MGQRREAGPEVVDRELHASLVQRTEHVEDRPVVLHDLPLGDLEDQALGGDVVRGQRLEHELGQRAVVEIANRHVHRHPDIRPGRHRPDRFIQDPEGELADQTRQLTELDELARADQPEARMLPPGERLDVGGDPGDQHTPAAFGVVGEAQSMDVLSSQSNLAGYKAVLAAADTYGRAFPMMMTAAGTVQAARCFVMGVGVAGLQAIATARRLGAQVSATDVRSATKEQIESLGAKPIFVEDVAGIEGEGSGGYATEMSEEYQKAQAELVSSHIAKQDIVITTALIPGRAAPRLISDAQIASMKPGSVIFDLAAPAGGNVEGCKPDTLVEKHGVTIMGYSNTPSHLPADASALFARNHYSFLTAFWDEETGGPVLDEEIGNAVRLTKGGEVVNERLQ